MAGFTTIDSALDRVRDLLREYLAAEVALVDTRNNALADPDGDNYFVSPTVTADDIQLHSDERSSSTARVVVRDGGTVRSSDMQLQGQVFGTSEPESSLPRQDRLFRFEVEVLVSSSEGEWGKWGARRRCNRIAEGVNSTILRYSDLAIPARSVTSLPGWLSLVDDGRAQQVKEDEWQHAARVIAYELRLIESRS